MDPRVQALHRPLNIPSKKNSQPKVDHSFRNVLEEAQGIKVSKHAKQRLEDRDIAISDSAWEKISSKMNEAKQIGVTDSLVITNEATLVVSTKNRTVVTALAREESASQIFTNINGTIFIND
ncbi:TIGR02530 family flagellar biosynthesis protein [Halobacillus sp. H74]|uniref:TIGR02530 family flagellar biosynthesis protein n=1 Tax=Halobacillus sp. H74 TaxID=3457436 RepID=UPI003FCD32B9